MATSMKISTSVILTRLQVPRLLSNRRTFLKKGIPVPPVDLYLDTPNNKVNAHDLFKGKRGVLFSVLGAFTPGCQNHIPEYLDNHSKFKDLGYDVIACVAVNDPFVMSAWAKSLNTDNKVLMLADPHAEFAKAMKMDLDCRHILGTVRSKRYSVVIEDSVIKGFNMEPDHGGLACLLCIQRLTSPSKPDQHSSDKVR